LIFFWETGCQGEKKDLLCQCVWGDFVPQIFLCLKM
jgi:hypothetical protein